MSLFLCCLFVFFLFGFQCCPVSIPMASCKFYRNSTLKSGTVCGVKLFRKICGIRYWAKVLLVVFLMLFVASGCLTIKLYVRFYAFYV